MHISSATHTLTYTCFSAALPFLNPLLSRLTLAMASLRCFSEPGTNERIKVLANVRVQDLQAAVQEGFVQVLAVMWILCFKFGSHMLHCQKKSCPARSATRTSLPCCRAWKACHGRQHLPNTWKPLSPSSAFFSVCFGCARTAWFRTWCWSRFLRSLFKTLFHASNFVAIFFQALPSIAGFSSGAQRGAVLDWRWKLRLCCQLCAAQDPPNGSQDQKLSEFTPWLGSVLQENHQTTTRDLCSLVSVHWSYIFDGRARTWAKCSKLFLWSCRSCRRDRYRAFWKTPSRCQQFSALLGVLARR